MHEAIIPFFINLLNTIFSKGYFPENWRESILLPIHKKGDPQNPDNYRGISLTSILSKVFTSILTHRLQNWAEINDIIVEEQAGFRRGYSTTDNIFVLQSLIHRNLSRKRKLYAAFVDFKKAFDTVNRAVLWDILSSYGINGRMLGMLQAIYSGVLCRVRCGGHYSEPIECFSGLKQGCKMSPIIFSLMVNYVAKLVINNGKHGIQLMPSNIVIYLLLFADDIVLVSDTAIGLQNQLNQLQRGADAIGLIVNRDKTKVMVFRNGGFLAANERWNLGGDRLEVVPEYRYLGTMFTTKLSFNLVQTDLTQRAKTSLAQVIRCMRKLQCMSPDVFFKLFDAQVASILLYSAEIWGVCDCSIIESVHLQAMKKYLNLPTKAPNVIIYGECGRYPLYINAVLRSVKYWMKLLRMESSRYPHLAYAMMLNSGNQQSWASKIKEVLYKFDFPQVWDNQCVQNERSFMNDLKERLINEYCNYWSQTLQSSERYSFYKQFKTSWMKEMYLSVIDKKIFRDMYIQFRTGFSELFSHRLRYRNINEDNLYICPSCRETFECEIHFLFSCPVYEDLRKKYLSHLYNLSIWSVADVLGTVDCSEIRSIAIYLYWAFKRRQEAMSIDFFSADVI